MDAGCWQDKEMRTAEGMLCTKPSAVHGNN